jgi:hypothetical protein
LQHAASDDAPDPQFDVMTARLLRHKALRCGERTIVFKTGRLSALFEEA